MKKLFVIVAVACSVVAVYAIGMAPVVRTPMANVSWPKTSTAVDTAFRMTWVVTSTNAVTVPGKPGLTYNSTINWGDGSGDLAVTAYDDADLTHSYNPTGTFNIVISGTFPSIYFNNTGSKTCLKNISNLGDVGWTTFLGAFYGCSSLTNVGGYADMGDVTTFANSFRSCSGLKAIACSTWDMSDVTSIGSMFYGCTVLPSVNNSAWVLTALTSMASSYRSTSALTNGLLPVLPVGLTTAEAAYQSAVKLTGDLSAVVNLASNNLFFGALDCDALTYSASNGCFSSNVKHLFSFNMQNATLSGVEGDRLLVDFNTSAATGGVFNISGSANQKVTVVGTNAMNALVAKGWTVTVP